MKISVLIPAYNEEINIAKTIESLKKALSAMMPPISWAITVVDDGSTDDTCLEAAKCQATILKLGRNLGKGGALEYALQHTDGDIVMFLDADVTSSAQEAPKLLQPLLDGRADVTIARFPPAARPAGLGLVKALAAGGVNLFTGHRCSAALSGQRAFTRQVLSSIPAITPGYSLEVGMLIDVLNHGYKVQEVDVNMHHKETGRNLAGFIHRGSQFWDILTMLLTKLGDRV